MKRLVDARILAPLPCDWCGCLMPSLIHVDIYDLGAGIRAIYHPRCVEEIVALETDRVALVQKIYRGPQGNENTPHK